MKALRTCLLLICLFTFSWQMQAQTFVDVYKGTSLPILQGWNELRFDNSMVWEQVAKDLLVAPGELSAVAGTALKLKVNEAVDEFGDPLYSQLGYYMTHTGFSPSMGFTVEFRAKIIKSDGAFSVSGVGAGKGFRLVFSNKLLVEHANELDVARVLSTADNTDGFHTYRVSVGPDNKVCVCRDGIEIGKLPLQPFKLDNILDDGSFENGGTAAEHGWLPGAISGMITISSAPEHVHSGKYGLFVDKGTHTNRDIPVKPNAVYDLSAWGKTIYYPTSDAWRDLNGKYAPADPSRSAYFVGDRNNLNWKYYERLGMEGGKDYQRFMLETETSGINNNQTAYDDLHYSERLTTSRIPKGAVNLFPNGDFEDPCADYFPEGDPRNDTCLVSPNNYRYSADAYYGGLGDNSSDWFEPPFNAEHNAAPFWHPFWGARVRMQYQRQASNGETGGYWARGKYALRFFNCGGANVPYGTDFTGGVNQNRGSNTNIKTVPIELAADKTYTFLFSYHMAKWEGDGMRIIVKNGNIELYNREAKGDNTFPDWRNEVIEFTTDADNHALQILTERLPGNWEGTGATPGVLYLDDLFLFQGQLLPEDNTHLFFGKPTSVKGAEVEIEWIRISNDGAYNGENEPSIAPWEKKTAPLMTVWGEALPQTAPVPPILDEYPRPQLKRDNWTNLNGIWQYAGKQKDGFGVYNANEAYRQEILVPFPIESALSGIMDEQYANQNKFHAYKRNVTIAKPTDGKRVILNFGAVDWESYVFVNGTQVAHHKGGYDPFSADITDVLNVNGNQEITVQAFDPAKSGQPVGKQDPTPNGQWYTPVSGIWQTVWTETVNPAYITNLALTPANNTAVKVKVEAANADGATATVKILDGTTEVASADVVVGTETSINIANPKLWSPQTPFLYNVTVALKKSGATTDEVKSYFGMRKLEVKQLRDKPFIYLNGEEAFTYATLDHGYFPDGIYTPASYDAMRYDLKKLKELGFNGVRKFEKIEPAVWYHLADSLGLLVWQDIPAAREDGQYISELGSQAARKANFLRETEAMTKSIRNFPSIVGWIGFNDGWGRYDYTHAKNTVNLFRSLNDGRLIVPGSGDDAYELGDVVSSHGLPIPVLHTNAYNERASVCFVTGNYNYVIDGHVWNTSASGDIKNDSTYAARLTEFSNAAKNLTLQGITGLAIVQTTDVENEINGLITYDRKVNKAGEKAENVLKASADFMQTKIAAPILKISAQGGEKWKYLAGSKELPPPTGWNYQFDFDDSTWSDGFSGFGSDMGWFKPNTLWTGDNRGLYLRKKVIIPELPAGEELKFTLAYDEDYEIYINGVLAHQGTSYVTSYKSIEIYPEAKAAIRYGEDNLFAIHVIQNNGGAAIDLGVTADGLFHWIDWEEPEPDPVWIDIATAKDWQNIRKNPNGFYRLVADINLYEESYTSIGNSATPFRGYIDGQNYTVYCPEIRHSSEVDQSDTKDVDESTTRIGLFGYADGAHFVNLRMVAGLVVDAGADAGVLLGRGKGITVEHVVFDEGKVPNQGGTVYRNEVYGRDHVGMVAGMFEAGKVSTIKDVYVVNGKVESNDVQAAGLVGIMCDTRIINSYFTGTVAITHADRLTSDNRDAAGIVARTEGGKNFFNGVMSLATKVESASGNEFISYNGGGYIDIDSATCFTRNDMTLDPVFNPNRGGQFARASESMKRPIDAFKSSALYKAAGWDFTEVWGIPIGGGFPIFRYLGGVGIPPVAKPENNLKVYSAYGNIVMMSDRPASVWIYNLQGALVERIDFTGTQSVALPRGIYIVRSAVEGSVKGVKVLNQ